MIGSIKIKGLLIFVTMFAVVTGHAMEAPNLLVIWGDAVGEDSISVYGHGIAGYKTPNIDRIASEGMLFTDYYAGRSSTAGRAAFITGQSVYRTGLSDAGVTGTSIGLHRDDPTIAGLLKKHGYMTGHFGKHHVGDRDMHLPTNHGFDAFLGSLYDYGGTHTPGKRGVIRAYANGRIVDTGPVNEARVATLDDETVTAAIEFMQRAHDEGKPFFVWWNDSGVRSGADAMAKHDEHVGRLLAKLDELGVADSTLVHYSTDRGAGISPFSRVDAGSEGGWRAPSIVRWPGRVEAGSVSNEAMHHLDWLPTLLTIAGAKDIRDRLRKDGIRVGGRRYRVHLDGYDFAPYLTGETDTGPRREVLYFATSGELVALRYDSWKGTFATDEDGLAILEAPALVNLRLDPYETGEIKAEQSGFVAPAQGYVGQYVATFGEFPPRESTGEYSIDAVLEMLQLSVPSF